MENTNGGGHELPICGCKLGVAALANRYMSTVGLDGVPDFAAPRLKRFFTSPHQGQIGLADRSVVKLLR